MPNPSNMACAVCGHKEGCLLCGGCESVAYCGAEHQRMHWKVHKVDCRRKCGKPVTEKMLQEAEKAQRALSTLSLSSSSSTAPAVTDSTNNEVDDDNATLAPNPLIGSYPAGRTGRTRRDPLPAFFHFKYYKSGKPKARMIKPGKLTPYIMTASPSERRRRGFKRSHFVATPYEETGNKQVRQANGKYRHIASYTLDELRRLGWDGAKYVCEGRHEANGLWVPFVCGYDSDPEHHYEPIDVEAGRRAGIIGLSADEIGLFMDVPSGGMTQLEEN